MNKIEIGCLIWFTLPIIIGILRAVFIHIAIDLDYEVTYYFDVRPYIDGRDGFFICCYLWFFPITIPTTILIKSIKWYIRMMKDRNNKINTEDEIDNSKHLID